MDRPLANPPRDEATPCRNHPDQTGDYFLPEQPWVKLCQSCALNMALYGKKIEKELSQKEFNNRLLLLKANENLGAHIKGVDSRAQQLNREIEILEANGQEIQQALKAVDEYINQMLHIKETLYQLHDAHICKRVADSFQTQSKMILCSLEMKKEMQSIESQFQSLIESPNLDSKLQKWAFMMDECRGILGSKVRSQEDISREMEELNRHFAHHLHRLQQRKLQFPNGMENGTTTINSQIGSNNSSVNGTSMDGLGQRNGPLHRTQLKLRSSVKKGNEYSQIKRQAKNGIRSRQSLVDISNFKLSMNKI